MLTPQDQIVMTSLEIVISFLVFGVGIPALIFDRPQWIRRIRDGHSKWAWYPTIAALLLSVFACFLAAFFISTPQFLGCFEQSLAQPNDLCQFIDWAERHAHTISGCLIILSCAITMGLWARLRSYRTKYVVEKVRNIALDRRNRKQNFDSGRAKKCIEHLGIIGSIVEIDDDKLLVLKALDELAKSDLLFDAMDPSYSLLRAHGEAVLKAASTGNADSQTKAIDIMQMLMSKVRKKKDLSVLIVPPFLNRLGQSVIELENDELDFALWLGTQSDITVHHATHLFNWGILALDLGRNETAIRFIDGLEGKTEAIISHDAPESLQFSHPPEIANLFVGLIAHFCTVNGTRTGETRQKVGWERLGRTFQGFGSDMDSLFNRSIDFFKLRSDFTTVDRIVELQANFNARISD